MHEALSDGLDVVDDVVELDGQVVDVLAVERCDERLLEPRADLAVDLVALLLERLDLRDALVEPVELVIRSRSLTAAVARFWPAAANRSKNFMSRGISRKAIVRPPFSQGRAC